MSLFRKRKDRDLRMIWKVERDRKRSFMVGTAHFFPFSFRTSLSRVIKEAKAVILEGPLDQENMSKVVEAGSGGANRAHLFEGLDSDTITGIARILAPGCRTKTAFLSLGPYGSSAENAAYAMLKGMKPWMAFFTIWSTFLKREGWEHSVDLEIYRIAGEMGKDVFFLESIEEQIEVLETLSYERIVGFLKRIDRWHAHSKEYVKSYLEGDLDGLRQLGKGFPSRHFAVIDRRDEIFFERMQPHLQEGDALICVGAPHAKGISRMLTSAKFDVQRYII